MKAGMTDDKPARVPARANQRWHAARIKALLDTESPKVILGDECEKPLPLARDPLTGKPDAGDPPVRFGGRGGALRHPYPYQTDDGFVEMLPGDGLSLLLDVSR